MVEKKEIFEYYKEVALITRAYLKIKLKICPLIALETHIPKGGTVIDLGCGNGLFPTILSLGSSDRQIIGIDLDEKKIAVANSTKKPDSDITYRVVDIVDAEYPQGDVITLVDALYLIPYKKQEVILHKCWQSLPSGGILIIKEMDTKPNWKYRWNILQETIAVKLIGFTLGERFNFRSKDEYQKLLQELGFKVRTILLHHGYWYPHITYFCVRK